MKKYRENVVVGQSEQDPKSNEDYEDYDSERDSLMSEPSFESDFERSKVDLITTDVVEGCHCRTYPPVSNGYGNDFQV